MTGYVARRLAIAVPTLLVISIILFSLLHLAPGGPMAMYLASPQADPAQLEEIERRLGLRDPIPIQYAKWLFGMLTGDWGLSYKYTRSVSGVIAERIGPSLQLMGASLVIALVLAIPFGMLAAVSRSRVIQYGVSFISMLGLSIPTFWLGMMLLLVLSVRYRVLPSGGMGPIGQELSFVDRLHYLIGPAFVLATLEIATWSRYVRSSVLEVLGQDFIRTARAKGLSERVVLYGHAFRNALLPLITLVGIQGGRLIGGAVITEAIFAWPGMGRLLAESLAARDYPVVMASFMIMSVMVILGNLIADVCYGIADPPDQAQLMLHETADAQPARSQTPALDSPASVPAQPGRSSRHSVARRFRRNWAATVGAVVLVLLVGTALIAPLVAPYDPEAVSYDLLAAPSPEHPLGTDDVGRDMLSRLIYASRVSLAVGVCVSLLTVTIGTIVGAMAGYYGGRIDAVLSGLINVVLSIPALPLAMVLGGFIEVNLRFVIVILALLAWTGTARLIRAEFLSLRERDYVLAARVLGGGDARLIVKHILPNTMAIIVVAVTIQVATSILAESALSYLGFGIQPPTASWGNMLQNSQRYFRTSPMVAVYPGLLISLTVIAVNFVGDGLRDALDPRLRT